MKRSFLQPSCLANEKEGDEKEEFFLKNGSLLLVELISLCHGHHNPIPTFSSEDLKKATKNYDQSLFFHADRICKWYKGSLEGRLVSVRKFKENEADQLVAVHEMAMAIKMSYHRGVLKLLGCSLDTQIPTLVYEFPTNNLLKDRIRPSGSIHIQPLTWKIRLKIAFEIAHVISYLHTAFPRPIIHRDIKLSHIFLGQNFVPKLSDFSLSVVLPEGESYVEDLVMGTLGYLAPEYLHTSKFTEKIDIYGFGVILLELLTGKKAIIERSDLAGAIANDKRINLLDYANCRVKMDGIVGIVDPKILEEGGGILEFRQFEAVFSLAQRCTKKTPDKRPTSTEAAKQLQKIQRGFFADEILEYPSSAFHLGSYHSTPSRESMEAAPSPGRSFHLGSYHNTPSREDMEVAPDESLLQPLQTDINCEDHSISESSSPPDNRAQTDDQHTVANEGPSERILDVVETYKTNVHVNPIFASVGADAKKFFTALEATDIVLEYIEKQKLVKPTDESIVVLDALLSNAFFKGVIADKSTRPTEIHKKDLGLTFINRMQAHHMVIAVHQGAPKKIRIITNQKDHGNRRVIRISGLESFFLDTKGVASELRKRFSCSTSMAEVLDKEERQVVVQGCAMDGLVEHLVEQYGIPKRYIEVLDEIRK